LLSINKHLAFVNRVSAPDAPFGYSFSRQPGFGTRAELVRHPVVSLEAVAQARERIRAVLDGGSCPRKEGLNALDGERIRETDTPPDGNRNVFVDAALPDCGSPDSSPTDAPFGDGFKRAHESGLDRGSIMAH
jgi:hypothetical protein